MIKKDLVRKIYNDNENCCCFEAVIMRGNNCQHRQPEIPLNWLKITVTFIALIKVNNAGSSLLLSWLALQGIH